jgi:hypothetical protein
LFAHASRGVPSIELRGLGSNSKIIKEKLVYWLKHHQLSIPPLRYVITLDSAGNFGSLGETYSWLELPIFFLLLVLGKVVSIVETSHCFCAGRLSILGTIEYPPEYEQLIAALSEKCSWHTLRTLIAHEDYNGLGFGVISMEELIQEAQIVIR